MINYGTCHDAVGERELLENKFTAVVIAAMYLPRQTRLRHNYSMVMAIAVLVVVLSEEIFASILKSQCHWMLLFYARAATSART